jgi:hypothetical protein
MVQQVEPGTAVFFMAAPSMNFTELDLRVACG